MNHAPLDLGVIGNCAIGALIDRDARLVWCCMPRFDGDPVFHALLGRSTQLADERGWWDIELIGRTRTTQEYVRNTAVLVTRQFDAEGNGIEVVDLAPRFVFHGRQFRPAALVRRVKPIAGAPRVVIRLRPAFEHGAAGPRVSHGSNHLRFSGQNLAIRVTTNAPISYILDERPFLVEHPLGFLLGADETPDGDIEELVRSFEEHTVGWWREWTRRLALPLEWQDAVIRAAITLKLCTFEETGAIVAAMTTSIPEAPGSERNWDYRYCWLRDAFFVVRALNSLAEVETMEHYLRFLHDLVAQAGIERLQPVYGVAREEALVEREIAHLTGFLGHRPVRIGNQAYAHHQHDVYGNAILAATQSFFDARLLRPSGVADFPRYERIGELAYKLHRTPDAGMWELRTRARVHTTSTLMCWAGCDRLARIAQHLGLVENAARWRDRAADVRAAIETEAWSDEVGAFVESFGGRDLDAGLLLMAEVGFLRPDDPRFLSTVAAIERDLKHGSHLFRYRAADDFGSPSTAFNACTFWHIDALARIGRKDEARELFEGVLAHRNHIGLLAEDVDAVTGQQWGNYPQTYSQAGIINSAVRLSRDWEDVV